MRFDAIGRLSRPPIILASPETMMKSKGNIALILTQILTKNR